MRNCYLKYINGVKKKYRKMHLSHMGKKVRAQKVKVYIKIVSVITFNDTCYYSFSDTCYLCQ